MAKTKKDPIVAALDRILRRLARLERMQHDRTVLDEWVRQRESRLRRSARGASPGEKEP